MKTLVIKGDRFQAAKAAANRGVAMVFLRELKDTLSPQTVGATDASVETLNRWLCEPEGPPPFPVGSLLIWSDHPGKTIEDLMWEAQ